MTTLTIQLSDDTAHRLRALANSRGISLDSLMEEASEAALIAHDTRPASKRWPLRVTGTPLWRFWRGSTATSFAEGAP